MEQRNKCKPSFKGIETFLRKVAFNLGNTPSQTEVKIISCIPVDVTDLQHKILDLEQQCETAERGPVTDNPAADAPPDTMGMRPANMSSPASIRPSGRGTIKRNFVALLPHGHTYTPEAGADDTRPDGRHTNKAENALKTQLVYYAQALNSPFTQYKGAAKRRSHSAWKHALRNCDSGQLTSPSNRPERLRRAESDMCTCCDVFRDLDAERAPGAGAVHDALHYDSSAFDLTGPRPAPRPPHDEGYYQKNAARPRYRPYLANRRPHSDKRNKHTTSEIPPYPISRRRLGPGASPDCAVDGGDAITKAPPRRPPTKKTSRQLRCKRISRKKNSECFALDAGGRECRQRSDRHVRNEATLDQIKVILQSVLTEVKPPNQTKTVSDYRKHAAVQKDVSQKDLEEAPSATDGSPLGAPRCLQHYPLLIQTGPQCACCFKAVPSRPPRRPAQPVSAATNTDHAPAQPTKERDILIKEIYKSLALDLNYPSKEASCEGDRSAGGARLKREQEHTGREVSSGGAGRRERKVSYYSSRTVGAAREGSRRHAGARRRAPPAEPSRSESSDTSSSSSDQTVVARAAPHTQKKEKAGILSKVANFFKSRYRSPTDKDSDSESEEERETHECRERSARRGGRHRRTRTSFPEHEEKHQRAHTPCPEQHERRKRKREPFLEQEERRPWRERLAFHSGDTPRLSSDPPWSRQASRTAHGRDS